MSYQVLARKWRPRLFSEMVGQEHVLRALINGLDNNRVHHAYLFTGTRGVGKTTIARILAKCLNCEQGVSSTPCGECSSCREIGEGRFVDLLEVDAASRTKVEDTRELLENVQYAPTRGRYKIYLIDEVHMLSTHSFNALLKTLEEPPPHVKFLLATTDPQKLPVTVLSRCLQFNLKNLGPERIVEHLKHILVEEKVPFEESALWDLGRAADGSMRDALSLTDQAIAHGGGTLTAAEVNAMLGTIDRGAVMDICQAVAGGDPTDVMAKVERLADHSPDYGAALADMLSLWHQVAIAQAMPDALDPVQEHHDAILALAQAISREDVQLLYQITLLGRKDLPFAADPRSGFEMVLLRLLAFRPELPDQPEAPPGADKQRSEAADPTKKSSPDPVTRPGPQPSSPPPGGTSRQPPTAPAPAAAAPVEREKAAPPAPPRRREESVPVPAAEAESIPDDYEVYAGNGTVDEPLPGPTGEQQRPPATPRRSEAPAGGEVIPGEVAAGEADTAVKRLPLSALAPETWIQVCQGLGQGLLPSLAANMVLESIAGNRLRLVLDGDNSALYSDEHGGRLAGMLSDYFASRVSVEVTVGDTGERTPRRIAERLRAERRQRAVEALRADSHLQELCRVFDGELLESTVKPIGNL